MFLRDLIEEKKKLLPGGELKILSLVGGGNRIDFKTLRICFQFQK